MARNNYSFKKRQKELARKKKQEAKRLRRLEKRKGPEDEQDETLPEQEQGDE